MKKILSLTFCFLLMACGDSPKEERIYYNLIALRNKDSVHGSQFLGIGSINYQSYYFYYYRNDDGSYTAHQISTYGVRVYEENRKDAVVIETINKKIKCDLLFLHNLDCNDHGPYYEFHVPKGTIVRDYHL